MIRKCCNSTALLFRSKDQRSHYQSFIHHACRSNNYARSHLSTIGDDISSPVARTVVCNGSQHSKPIPDNCSFHQKRNHTVWSTTSTYFLSNPCLIHSFNGNNKSHPFTSSTNSNNKNIMDRDALETLTKNLLQYDRGSSHRVTPRDFNSAIDAWAHYAPSLGINAARKAEKLLRKVEILTASSTNIQLQAIPYNSCINAYAKCHGGREAAIIAESILMKMKVRPTRISFHCAMHAWAKSNQKDAGMNAERLMKQMEHDYKIKPNSRTFSLVMDAHGNSYTKDGPERATNLLKRMMEHYLNGGGIRPGTVAFNTVLNAWAKSKQGTYAAERAQEVFSWLVKLSGTSTQKYEHCENDDDDEISKEKKPDVRSYSMLIDVWAKSRANDAAQKCEFILKKMLQMYEQGSNIKPNVICFTMVINALSKAKNNDGAYRAESILNTMLSLYEQSDRTDEDLKPDTIMWNAVIHAYAKRAHHKGFGSIAVQRALRLLDEMETLGKEVGRNDILPDIVSYNTVLDCLARCHHSEEGVAVLEKVEELLCRINSANVVPDLFTHNSILKVYAQHKEPTKAKNYLLSMEEMYRSGDINDKPNYISYTIVINAYANKIQPAMALDAQQIFHRMIHRDIQPDTFTYVGLINACANNAYIPDKTGVDKPKEKQEALDIALNAFDYLKKSSVRPNHYIYGSMIKACASLASNPDQRVQLLKHYFIECCEEGCVSELVLRTFQKESSIELWKELCPEIRRDKALDISDIPVKWRRNVAR